MGKIFKRNLKIQMGKPIVGNESSDLATRAGASGLASSLDSLISVGGGGAGIGVTVGGSGSVSVQSPDFSTVREAISAGHRIINVVSDTLETANVSLTSTTGITITLYNGAEINLQSFYMTLSSCNKLLIAGNGILRSTTTSSGVLELFGSEGRVEGIEIKSDGANAWGLLIGNGSRCVVDGVKITSARMCNVARNSVGLLNSCRFIGRSPNEGDAGVVADFGEAPTSVVKISDCTWEGQWGNSSAFAIGGSQNNGNVWEIYNCRIMPETDGNALVMTISPPNHAKIVGLGRTQGADEVYIVINELDPPDYTDGLFISNVDFGSPSISWCASQTRNNNIHMTNCVSSGNFDFINYDNAHGGHYSNLKIGNGNERVQVRGTNNVVSNCTFQGGLSVEGSGNLITNCQIEGSTIFSFVNGGRHNILRGSKINSSVTFNINTSGNMIADCIIGGTIAQLGNNISSNNLELNI